MSFDSFCSIFPLCAPWANCTTAPDLWLRAANVFSFVERGTDKIALVKAIPDGFLDDGEYDLIAFITPFSGGVRRACRARAGYTPLYSNSHPDLWQMETVLARVPVHTPHFGWNELMGDE